MNLAILRVEGPEASLAQLKELLGLSSDMEWQAGERRRDGSIRESSGLNSTIADAETAERMTNAIREFLMRCEAAEVTFPWQGITAEVDVGFTVGDSTRFAGGFRLSPSDVRACAECGLGLSVAAYPTSDEANAT